MITNINQKINNFSHRLFRVIGRNLIKYSADPRPASYPYISGDGFRKLARFIYDIQIKNIEPDLLNEGDVVFVNSVLIEEFFLKIHPLIKRKYILITHNSDIGIGSNLLGYVDDKIIRWYGQNLEVSYEKLTPLPIGLENLAYYNNGIAKIFDNLRKGLDETEKLNRILFGFNVSSNPQERKPAFDSLIVSNVSDQISEKLESPEYLKLLMKYKFVASPPGNGLDCHRTWEALYLKTVPIVKRSVMTEYFFHLGLPLWIIDDWSELVGCSERQLAEKYEALKTGFDNKALLSAYWISRINIGE